jgi:hypothetical protein
MRMNCIFCDFAWVELNAPIAVKTLSVMAIVCRQYNLHFERKQNMSGMVKHGTFSITYFFRPILSTEDAATLTTFLEQ